MNQQRDEYESVGHLVELGYVDPQETTLRELAVRQQLEVELQQAIAAIKAGRDADVVAALNRLEVDDPDWIAPHQLLAELHLRAGRFEDAENELKWLEYHAIERPAISLLSARIAVARRHFSEALDLLDYASYVAPELSGVHTLHGIVLLRLGKLELAEQALEKALQQQSTDVRALDAMAAISLRRGDFEDAANWALSAVEADMQFARAHYNLGVSLAKMGRPAEAIAALETCVRIDPNCAAPFRWLATIAGAQPGDDNRATSYRKEGLERLRQRKARRRDSDKGGTRPSTD